MSSNLTLSEAFPAGQMRSMLRGAFHQKQPAKPFASRKTDDNLLQINVYYTDDLGIESGRLDREER